MSFRAVMQDQRAEQAAGGPEHDHKEADPDHYRREGSQEQA